MPNEDAGQARHADPGNGQAGCGQCHLVPDRGHGLRQVRVTGQHGPPPGDRRAVGRPGVAVRVPVDRGRQGVSWARSADAAVASGAGMAAPGAAWPGPPGRHRRGERAGRADRRDASLEVRPGVVGALLVRGEDGEPRHGARRPERALKQRVVQRGRGEVEFLGQVPLHGEAVHRGPVPRVDTGQGEQGRPVAAGPDLGEVVVHPARIRQQRAGDRA